jgi:hypothetical protein
MCGWYGNGLTLGTMMIFLSKLRARGLAASAIVLAAGTGAFAGPTLTLDTNSYSDSSGGGEFTVVGSGLSNVGYAATTGSSFGAGDFETFCMAFNEDFVPGNSFGYTLGTTTMGDGSNPNVPLTQGAAYLYSQFAKGTLTNYDYSNASSGQFSSRANAAEALQIAIWWVQGLDTGGIYSEGAPVPNSGDNYYVNLLSGIGATWATTVASPDYDGVKVLVLDNSNSSNGSTPYSQPQLYYSVPDNGTTVLLLGVALVGLVAIKRQMGKAV